MRTLLTTAACAALVAGIASASAQQTGQDDGARSVSPDEYFGTRAREATSQPPAQMDDDQAPTDQDEADLTGDDSAEALNARQLRDMQNQDDAASSTTSARQNSSMADRLRQRSQTRRGGQDAASTGGGMVTVMIEGANGDADVYVALQTEGGFASGGGEYTRIVTPDGGQAEAAFDGVAPGDYAVAVFQDTDGDGTVTLGRTGPTEPFGFSGDVAGAPRFEDAMVSVTDGAETDARVQLTGGDAQADIGTVAADGQQMDRDARREAMRRRNLGQDTDSQRLSDDDMRMSDTSSDDMMPGAMASGEMASGEMTSDEMATVTVTITGAERRGQVYVALQDQAGFAQSGGAYTQKTRVRRGEAEVTFEDVTPGRYAVAVFQDTDRDGELTLTDTGPTEPWGFSGDVSGAPSFDAAAIDAEGDTRAEVALQSGSEMSPDDAADPMMGAPTDAEPMDAEPMDAEPMDAEPMDADESEAEDRDARMGDMDTSAPMMASPRSAAPALVYRRSASLSDDALTADDYLDGELVNQDGDEVAEVKDVILDQSGTARGVVLASGGLFGLGENHYAVNFDRVSPEMDGGVVVLRSALSEDDIERLRDFDYDAFKADKDGMLLATELRGARVMVGDTGTRARVQDVVMNRMGGVEAMVLDYDGDMLVAPFDRVQIGADGSMMIAGTRTDMDGLSRYEGRPGQQRRRGVMRR